MSIIYLYLTYLLERAFEVELRASWPRDHRRMKIKCNHLCTKPTYTRLQRSMGILTKRPGPRYCRPLARDARTCDHRLPIMKSIGSTSLPRNRIKKTTWHGYLAIVDLVESSSSAFPDVRSLARSLYYPDVIIDSDLVI